MTLAPQHDEAARHLDFGYPATQSRIRIPPVVADDGAFFPLQAVSTLLRFARNRTIFNEGDDARYSYRIVEGGVRLCKVRHDGRRQIAEFLLPGDVFGFENGREYSLTAEALCDAVVVRYPRHHVERLSEEIPGIRRKLMALLLQELSAAQYHLMMLGRQTAKERVASFLLVLAERQAAEDGDTLDLPMGRQDIADYLGLTVETVCRALADMKREHLIAVPNRHQVTIRDAGGLGAVAEGG